MDPLAALHVETHFGALDWALVVVFIVSMTWVGIYSRKYVTDMTDFVVAGRAVRAYLGVATMVATEMGLVTVMYSAQKGFLFGFSAFHMAAAAAIVAVIVGLTGFVVVPLRHSGAMTIPDYLQQRYNRGVRVVAGLILAFSGILNMGMFLYADSLFVTSVMGMTDPLQLKIAMTIMLVLVLVYTMLGGMIAVLVTDFIQFLVMAVALVGTSWFLLYKFGWWNMITTVEQIKGEAGFNPVHPNAFSHGYVIWQFFLGMVSCCLWQTAVIRASSAESEKIVRQTFTWGSVGFLIRFLVPYFWGIAAICYVAQRPELRAIFLPANGQAAPEVTLRAMPLALGSLVPPGALGLLVAGMLAAAMSTYNSYLHCWSSVLTHDVFGPVLEERLSSRQRIHLTQFIMVLIGIFLLVWGLWYPLAEDLWDYMAVTGAIYFTGAFAALVGGLYWKRASTAGAYASFIFGLTALVGLTPVQRVLGVEWRPEYVGLSTVALTALVMIVVSLLVPDRKPQEEPLS